VVLRNIFKDAIFYPSEDWMKVIILGFLSLISFIGLLTPLNIFTFFLVIIPLPLGYLFRVLKTSFEGSNNLPDFDRWMSMYTDGIRVVLVSIIYAVPIIVMMLLFNPDTILSLSLSSFSVVILWGLITGSVIQLMVFIIISLIGLVALANLALYQGEISAAFRFREIIKRIAMIGWKNYLITYVLIWAIALIIMLLSSLTFTSVIGIIIIPLIIAPYFIILSTRLLALVFASSES
jgi:hypothetical protein